MTKFEIGKTYTTRSICDHECIYTAKVLKRTAKTVLVKLSGESEPKRRRVREWRGVECFNPFGTYSMAPVIRAA